MKIIYYFDGGLVEGAIHENVCRILRELQECARVTDIVIADHREAFAAESERQKLLEDLSDFSMRRQVGLARVFGSRRHGFWYLPPQFLLVYEGDGLREVFPCKVGGRDIEILDFLKHFASGEAWTTRSSAWREGGRHRELVDRLSSDPSSLELGLTLKGLNVPVSRGFGERGLIDAVFQKADGGYLLVEVKGKPEELDKAVGQILRHRQLFAAQNSLDERRVDVAIACPFIPADARKVCEGVGIRWLELKSRA
ncbi:MAG: HTH domain-containing protein [Candidatus Binatia bacterium]